MPRSMSWRTLGSKWSQLDSLPLSFAAFAERTGTIIAAEGYKRGGDLCDQTDLPVGRGRAPAAFWLASGCRHASILMPWPSRAHQSPIRRGP